MVEFIDLTILWKIAMREQDVSTQNETFSREKSRYHLQNSYKQSRTLKKLLLPSPSESAM